jgi:hypothetical protein
LSYHIAEQIKDVSVKRRKVTLCAGNRCLRNNSPRDCSVLDFIGYAEMNER